MRPTPPIRSVLLAAALAGATACSDSAGPVNSPVPPPVTPVDHLPGLIVSSPVAAGSASGDSLVYISLVPGSVPAGERATITDQATGQAVTAGVAGGGFDPVALAAGVGDTLFVEITRNGSEPLHGGEVVAAYRPPVVVRTSPPSGGTDVPLDSVVGIVFSEPLWAATVDPSSVKLWRDATPISGTVGFADTVHLRVDFHPTSLLVPGTDYHLVIETAIRDLKGLALDLPVVVPFTTLATNFTPSIAFESTRDGSSYIYVANADGSGVTELVPGTAPVWSRAGSRIAYYTTGVGGPPSLIVMDPDGSHARFLEYGQQDLGPPSWGPGDREIAYRGEGGIVAVASDGSGFAHLLISDALTLPRPAGWSDADHDPGWVESPVWSPDGSQIAFLRVDPINTDWGWGEDRNMYVINADGSNPRLLDRSCQIPPPGSGTLPCPVVSLAWSPSGASVAVSTRVFDANNGVFQSVLGITPASLDSIGGDLDIIYHGIGGDWVGGPQWAPDGSAIIFSTDTTSAGTTGVRIWALSVEGRVMKQLIPDAAQPVLTPYVDEYAVWRPRP